MSKFFLFAAALLPLASVTHAQAVIDTAGAADGKHYVEITIAGGKVVNVVPLGRAWKLTGDGGPTTPPTTPGEPTPFSLEVKRQTAAVLAAGGSPTTAAGLSSAYSLVSAGVADGSINLAAATPAITAAVGTIINRQADGPKWSAWQRTIANAIDELRAQGRLGTKEAMAGTLKEIAAGIDLANGGTPIIPQDLVKLRADQLATAAPLFENIDLAKLIELIKLILELIKAFQPGGANVPTP